jgi:hypothetical protein
MAASEWTAPALTSAGRRNVTDNEIRRSHGAARTPLHYTRTGRANASAHLPRASAVFLAPFHGTWFAGRDPMNSQHVASKTAPARELDLHTAEPRQTGERDAARTPSNEDGENDLYNLPFTD